MLRIIERNEKSVSCNVQQARNDDDDDDDIKKSDKNINETAQ